MKKLITLISCTIMLIACNNSTQKEDNTTSDTNNTDNLHNAELLFLFSILIYNQTAIQLKMALNNVN